jgi:hypothetical protein
MKIVLNKGDLIPLLKKEFATLIKDDCSIAIINEEIIIENKPNKVAEQVSSTTLKSTVVAEKVTDIFK